MHHNYTSLKPVSQTVILIALTFAVRTERRYIFFDFRRSKSV